MYDISVILFTFLVTTVIYHYIKIGSLNKKILIIEYQIESIRELIGDKRDLNLQMERNENSRINKKYWWRD